MRYVDFRDSIQAELSENAAGLTWGQLKERLSLPYAIACPDWVRRMEQDIGLERAKGQGRAYVWKVPLPRRRSGRAVGKV